MKDDKVCLEIERFREFEFAGLREEINRELHRGIMRGLVCNSSYREGARALKLAQEVGLFEYYDVVVKEIANLEVRFGVSFRTILAALAEVDADPELPAMCQAFQEAKNPS